MPANILLVDDDPLFLGALSSGLRGKNPDYQFISAASGRAALDRLAHNKIDLIVTDLVMPEMSGSQLMAQVISKGICIPIVVLSGYVYDQGAPLGYRGELCTFLSKPVSTGVLLETIQSCLGDLHEKQKSKTLLTAINQLIALEKRTCIMKVQSQECRGSIRYLRGSIVEIEAGAVKGNEAFDEIMRWEDISLELQPVAEEKPVRSRKKEQGSDKPAASSIRPPRSTPALDLFMTPQGTAWDFEKMARRETKPISDPPSKVTDSHSQETIHKDPKPEKEAAMNTKKLVALVEILKEETGPGLLACDLISSLDGQSVAGFNTQPKACALFARLTAYLHKTLAESGFPALGRYYLLELAAGNAVLIIPMGSHLMGMLIDTKKAQVGLLVNVVIDKIINGYAEANGT